MSQTFLLLLLLLVIIGQNFWRRRTSGPKRRATMRTRCSVRQRRFKKIQEVLLAQDQVPGDLVARKAGQGGRTVGT